MKKQKKNLVCSTCNVLVKDRLKRDKCSRCYQNFMNNESISYKLKTIYNRMYQRCNNKNKENSKYYLNKKLCSREEFLEKFENDNTYKRLFKNWIESGRQLKLTPSIDRIDNTKGYDIDNLQFITHSQNCSKDKHSVPVMVIKDQRLIGIFSTLGDAAKFTGLDVRAISRASRGIRKHVSGYTFVRLDDE